MIPLQNLGNPKSMSIGGSNANPQTALPMQGLNDALMMHQG